MNTKLEINNSFCIVDDLYACDLHFNGIPLVIVITRKQFFLTKINFYLILKLFFYIWIN